MPKINYAHICMASQPVSVKAEGPIQLIMRFEHLGISIHEPEGVETLGVTHFHPGTS